jgi:hypothetical protein
VQADHQDLVAHRGLGLIDHRHQPLARRRNRGHGRLGVGRHHPVDIDPRIGQQALDPLIAHVHPAGRARQRGRQVHQFGAAQVQHGGNQKTQFLALRLALPRQAPTQILDDPP